MSVILTKIFCVWIFVIFPQLSKGALVADSNNTAADDSVALDAAENSLPASDASARQYPSSGYGGGGGFNGGGFNGGGFDGGAFGEGGGFGGGEFNGGEFGAGKPVVGGGVPFSGGGAGGFGAGESVVGGGDPFSGGGGSGFGAGEPLAGGGLPFGGSLGGVGYGGSPSIGDGSCPLCDSSVYDYCSYKMLHDSCCCDFPPHAKPQQCIYTDCNLLYAKTCYEHNLIKNCCCNRLY